MDDSLHAQRNRAALFRAHRQARRAAALASQKRPEIARDKTVVARMIALPHDVGSTRMVDVHC